MNYLWFDLW